jgi:RNA-directed DNA polymerase
VSLLPPVKVGKLQTALHTKAKNSPDYRFYALYDKIYRWDVLGFAYARCRSKAVHRGSTARASPRSRSTA